MQPMNWDHIEKLGFFLFQICNKQKVLDFWNILKVPYVGFNQLKPPPLPQPFQACIRAWAGRQVAVAYFRVLTSTLPCFTCAK